MRILVLVLWAVCCIPESASAADEPAYVNYDRGWVRDPYAGSTGEKAVFDSVAAAMDVVTAAERLEGQAIGYGHQRSTIFAAYEFLADNASEDQLFQLLKSKNATARCYAIMALTDKLQQDQLGEYSATLVNDHDSFSTLHYDMGGDSTVADCMIQSWYSRLSEQDKDNVAHTF